MFGLRALACLMCFSFAACDTSTSTGATGKIGTKGGSGEANITLASDCDPDQVPNCNGGCTAGWWLGDGECDTVLNCEQLSYDNGDCP